MSSMFMKISLLTNLGSHVTVVTFRGRRGLSLIGSETSGYRIHGLRANSCCSEFSPLRKRINNAIIKVYPSVFSV